LYGKEKKKKIETPKAKHNYEHEMRDEKGYFFWDCLRFGSVEENSEELFF
jgi:hypothetical protein